MHLIQQYGFFVLIPALFVVVGVGMFINITWGLLTGGPRALNQPGMPYLYDRLYYLLFLFVFVGWAGGLLSFLSNSIEDKAPAGFLIGWGICAIGMGCLFGFRRDMMLRGSRYLAKHGFWLWRFFHRMQVMQWERQSGIVLKVLPGVIIVAGIVVLAFNVVHLPEALKEVHAGSQILLDAMRAP